MNRRAWYFSSARKTAAPIPIWPPEAGALWTSGVTLQDATGTWKGIAATDFLVLLLALQGSSTRLSAVVAQRRALGFNCLRVLGMVDSFARLWPQDWPEYYLSVRHLADLLALEGLRLEFVVFADAQVIMPMASDEDAHLDKVIQALDGTWNTTVEIANEPFKNLPGGDKRASEMAQRVRGRGLLIAEGDTSQQPYPNFLPQADYGTQHDANRNDQWPRKPKDLYDLQGAVKIPWSYNEPMGADEVDQPGRRSNVATDFRFAGGVGALYGPCTFHSSQGINSDVWTGKQLECAKAWSEGAHWVPRDAPLWPYQRGDMGSEAGIGNMPILHDDAKSLRTFAKSTATESWAIAIRPTDAWQAIPRDGWTIAAQPWRGFVYLQR